MAEPTEPDGDPRDPSVLGDQQRAYDEMRSRCPVAHSDFLGWSLFAHRDVVAAARDTGTFSSATKRRAIPNGMDPTPSTPPIDIPSVTEVWRRGSVVASWLLDLAAGSLVRSGDLSDFAGRVSDSGEGRWTSIAAIDVSTPAPVLTTALYERFSSGGETDFADRVLSAMRFGFGGHEEGKG